MTFRAIKDFAGAIFYALVLLSLSGCGAGAPPEDASPIDRALAAERIGDDRLDDEMRKPADVLAFIDIQPGDRIFEIEAGRGYYTELFSALAGPEGRVVMQNPPNFDPFLRDDVTARLAGGRLGNVRLSKTPFDALNAGDASADIVTWMLGPHELYFTPSDGADLGDPNKAFSEIARILAPGGRLIVLDHAAAPGTPPAQSGAVHRIDPAVVRQLAEAAGLGLSAESDILRNKKDDYEMNVFDPKIRRKTDRFLFEFTKPE